MTVSSRGRQEGINAVSMYVESNIQFDFTNAHKVIEFEALLKDFPGASPTVRNTFWPGIDFHIEEQSGEAIWLEVKSWNPTVISPKNRGGSRRSFQCKMKSAPFAEAMRGKFFGTSAYFGWDNRPLPTRVLFLLLFEPPQPIDSALMLTFGHKIKSQLMPPKVIPWRKRIEVAAMDLTEWNKRYPDYPTIFE